jgi:O-antigen/teichoic acid export membrane protein
MMATLGAVQVLTIGFNLGRVKIAALAAGPDGVGVISIIDQLVAVVAHASLLSLPFASVKFLSAAHSRDREAFQRGYSAFFLAILFTTTLGTAVGAALVGGWPLVLGRGLADHRWIALIALAGIPLAGLTGLLTSTMAAARRTRPAAVYGLAAAATLALLSGAGILLVGLWGYYAGSLAGSLMVAAGGVIYLSRREGLRFLRQGVRVWSELRSDPATLHFAMAIYASAFALPLAFLVARHSVLAVSGPRGAGLLQAAMGLGLALGAVMRSSNALFLTPAMNRRDPEDERYRTAVEFQKAMTIMASLLAFPIVLFPHVWISVVYSGEFLPAAQAVYLFVLAEVLLLMSGVNASLLIGLNRIGTHITAALAGDMVLGVLSWLLVPSYGLAGVGVALLAGNALRYILTSWRLWASHRMPVHRALGWHAPVAVAVVALAGGAIVHLGVGVFDFLAARILAAAVFGAAGLATLRWGKGGIPTSAMPAAGQG